jgi:uncharacterized coiled-coil DUF342 family protein
MKISQKQATLLAKEIISQLNAKKTFKVSNELRQQIKAFCEKRKELWAKVNEAKEEVNRHEMTLHKIVGRIDHLYTSDSLERIIEKVEAKNVPTVSQVEDEILLKAMFANEDDMQAFIDKIVSKYSKKIQAKVLNN